jgi:phosphoglycerol transferase MdoB-like AlkP superfamily enzyme
VSKKKKQITILKNVSIFLIISLIFVIFSLGTKFNRILPFYELVNSTTRFSVIFSIFLPLSLFLLVNNVKGRIKVFILILLITDFILFIYPINYSNYIVPFSSIETPKILESIKEEKYNYS